MKGRRERVSTPAARVKASPQRVARSALRTLAGMARPHGTFDASRYFRSTSALGFYNVGTPAVRSLARTILRAHRNEWTRDDALVFAETLIAHKHLEAKDLGVEVLSAYRKDFTPQMLAVWKRWLVADLAANWATTDDICGTLIGPLLVKHPQLVPVVAGWRHHRSLWVRRASAVGLLNAIRRGRALDEAYVVARALREDPADLIQKAVGWMLREAGKVDPRRLERYLVKYGGATPRTTVRYAIERFAPLKRAQLLSATRPNR